MSTPPCNETVGFLGLCWLRDDAKTFGADEVQCNWRAGCDKTEQ